MARIQPPGAPDPRRVTEGFTVEVDAGAGTDPVQPLNLTDQVTSDAHGVFATANAALESIADGVVDDVTLNLGDGVNVLSQTNFERFQWGANGMKSPFSPQHGHLIFTSKNGRTIVSGTPTAMAVVGSSGGVVTLSADPGLVADAHQDAMLEVVSGTGAGQYKPIRAHTTVTFSCAGGFSPVLDGTSVVEIKAPAAQLQIQEDFPTFKFQKHSLEHGIVFRNVDVTNVNPFSGARWIGGSMLVEEGARVLNQLWSLSDASLLFGTCTISKDFPGGVAVLDLSGAFLRSNIGNSAPMLLRSSSTPVGIRFQTADRAGGAFVFGGHAFDGFTDAVIEADGQLNEVRWGSSSSKVPTHNGTASFAVRVKNGAAVRVNEDDLPLLTAQGFTGSTSDLDLDGNSGAGFSWTDVDADSDKVMIGKKQSRVFEEV